MVNVSVNGSEVIARLDNVATTLEDKVSECVAKVGFAIEAAAKNNCPANSGDLRRSIMTLAEGLEAVVGSNLEYAVYVHEGTGIYSRSGMGRQQVPWRFYNEKTGEWQTTSGIEPTPFLEDAVNAIAPDITQYFAGVLGDE